MDRKDNRNTQMAGMTGYLRDEWSGVPDSSEVRLHDGRNNMPDSKKGDSHSKRNCVPASSKGNLHDGREKVPGPEEGGQRDGWNSVQDLSEEYLRDGLKHAPVPTDRLQQSIEASLAELRAERRRKLRRRRITACGSAAAVFAAAFLLCVSNPALAEKLPVIGSVFESLRNRTSVKGDLSANAERLISEDFDTAESSDPDGRNADAEGGQEMGSKAAAAAEEGQNAVRAEDSQAANTEDSRSAGAEDSQVAGAEGSQIARAEDSQAISTEGIREAGSSAALSTQDSQTAEAVANTEKNAYVQTSNGITMTVSELTCDGESLYLGMMLYSEAGFPEDLIHVGEEEGYEYEGVTLEGICALSFAEEDSISSAYRMEGLFDDVQTFQGILQLSVSGYTRWPDPKQLEEAGISLADPMGEEAWSDASEEELFDEMEKRQAEYQAKVQETFPWAGEAIEVPEEFYCDLNIRKISARLRTSHDEEKEFPDGEKVMVPIPDHQEYEGTWNFHFPVRNGCTVQNETVLVGQTNESGVGIKAVTRTPYTVTAELILPPEALRYNYMLVFCDAMGDPMEEQGHSMETCSTEGRDTSTVYVYVCDYVEYLDELREYGLAEDYAEKRMEKTFAQYLSEHALFGTKVTFEVP